MKSRLPTCGIHVKLYNGLCTTNSLLFFSQKKKLIIINKLNSYPKLLNCNVQKETYIESRQLYIILGGWFLQTIDCHNLNLENLESKVIW